MIRKTIAPAFLIRILKGFTLITSVSLMGACVSVNLPVQSNRPSSGVKFLQPKPPFEEITSVHADRAWQNTKNGNSISFLSECNDPNEPSLDSVQRDYYSDFSSLQISLAEDTKMDGRHAVRIEGAGLIEGVATQIRMVVFKKNGCLYTISFIGLQTAFAADRPEFDSFVGSFSAP